MESTYHTSEFTITIERKEIEVTTSMGRLVPDMKWEFTDAHGHEHRFVDKKTDTVETLEWVVTGSHWVGDEYESWEVEDGEWRCRECAEVVKPRFFRSYEREFIQGLDDIRIETPDGGVWLLRPDEIKTTMWWQQGMEEDFRARVLALIASREPDTRTFQTIWR